VKKLLLMRSIAVTLLKARVAGNGLTRYETSEEGMRKKGEGEKERDNETNGSDRNGE
jgi:hypothetical protein